MSITLGRPTPGAVRRALTLATAAAATLALAPAGAQAATLVKSVEAEPMSLPTGTGSVQTDASASAGKYLLVWSNATASRSVTTYGDAATIVVRARGTQCSGAPSMTLRIDGALVGTKTVSSTSWADYSFTSPVKAGTHTIAVSFTNDYKTSTSCDRNLSLDLIRFDAADAPATTQPAPTATPTTPTVEPTPAPTAEPTPAPTTTEPAPAPTTQPSVSTAFPAQLHTSAGKIVDGANTPVALKGFNVIPVWASSPGQTWGADHYTRLKSAGFTAVRFVVYWDEIETSRGSYNQTHLATLDKAIGYARAAGVYVILDPIHLYGGGNRRIPGWAWTGNDVDSVRTNGSGYLKMLAARYKDNRTVAAIDAVNEPGSTSANNWAPDNNRNLRMYNTLFTAIRSVVADRYLLMFDAIWGTNSWVGTDWNTLPDRHDVVLTYHDYYAGGAGAGYTADGKNQGTWTFDEVTGYPAPNAGALEQNLLVHVNAAKAAGVPMWIGEMGINPTKANANLWIDTKMSLYRKYGIGYAWWAYTPNGGLSAMTAAGGLRPFTSRLY